MSRDYLSRRRGSLSPCYLVVGRWLCCDRGQAAGIKGPKLDFCPSAAWRGARKFCTLTARGNFAMDVLKRCFVRHWPATAYFLREGYSCLLQRPAFLFPWRSRYTIALLYYTTTEKRLSRVTFVSVPIQKWPLQHIFFFGVKRDLKKKILTVPLFFVKCRLGDIDSERLLLKQ